MPSPLDMYPQQVYTAGSQVTGLGPEAAETASALLTDIDNAATGVVSGLTTPGLRGIGEQVQEALWDFCAQVSPHAQYFGAEVEGLGCNTQGSANAVDDADEEAMVEFSAASDRSLGVAERIDAGTGLMPPRTTG